MHIPQEIKQQACEGLLHFVPKKRLSRELGVSTGAVRDWSIFIEHGFFDWLRLPYVGQRKELLHKAVNHWFDQYPIGYTDVARRFGIRPATLYEAIKRAVAKLPEKLRPRRICFWDVQTKSAPGKFRMAIEKLSDIPADRPLTTAERKALLEEVKDAKVRLACAESLLEVAVESCKDELKKKELQRQLELTRKALKSFGSVGQ